ncbi:hypothetical protein ACRAWF_34655 [Streptomyces sp. L7]
MTGLEPEGRFTKTRFTREKAEKTLDDLIKQLEAVDPQSTKDRWVAVHNGKSFRAAGRKAAWKPWPPICSGSA